MTGADIRWSANAALPHGSGTDRALRRSDFVLVDCGGSMFGYHSDVTRVRGVSMKAVLKLLISR